MWCQSLNMAMIDRVGGEDGVWMVERIRPGISYELKSDTKLISYILVDAV